LLISKKSQVSWKASIQCCRNSDPENKSKFTFFLRPTSRKIRFQDSAPDSLCSLFGFVLFCSVRVYVFVLCLTNVHKNCGRRGKLLWLAACHVILPTDTLSCSSECKAIKVQHFLRKRPSHLSHISFGRELTLLHQKPTLKLFTLQINWLFSLAWYDMFVIKSGLSYLCR